MGLRHCGERRIGVAMGLSLALHLAVLQAVGLPLPTEVLPEQALAVRLRPSTMPPAPPRPQAAQQTRKWFAPQQAAPDRFGSRALAHDEEASASVAATATEAVGRLTAAVPRERLGSLLPAAVGGQMHSDALPGAVSSATSQPPAAEATGPRQAVALALGHAGGGSVSQGDTTAEDPQVGVAAPRAVAWASVVPAAGVPAATGAAPSVDTRHREAAAEGVGLLHAQTAAAAIATHAPATLDADRAPHPGGELALAAPVERHSGVRMGGSLLTATGLAADVNALPGLSGQLATAALTREGRDCFKYTPQLHRQHREGRLVLRLQVGRDGRVQAAEIKQSSGDAELDAVARAQALHCARFSLLDRDGRPVSATIEQPIQYRLIDER